MGAVVMTYDFLFAFDRAIPYAESGSSFPQASFSVYDGWLRINHVFGILA